MFWASDRRYTWQILTAFFQSQVDHYENTVLFSMLLKLRMEKGGWIIIIIIIACDYVTIVTQLTSSKSGGPRRHVQAGSICTRTS